ncbi:hypothetical protein PAAG_05883 [Paracoccidioides lutzii Pb01]|uniref:Condensation domain-containing protein n=1 Tax=Paracoccidioides lutzii (strain ATCC MYA-826 / Pb01) TaxID=502779 RepID=C1H542_PARBA|nr:hypothetical protein PAAG_05883 [Paracoccidioides lutzii Pb01]EEH34836.2 hypothetical protein PAAG_05883 [Paracoccidioides lutzii Pb01]
MCMDRSPEFIATILAILRSEAASVTLDPDGSPERNWVIVEDCNADLVVNTPVDGTEAMDGPTLTLVPQLITVERGRTLQQQVIKTVNHSLWDIVRYSQYGLKRVINAAGHQDSELDTTVNIAVNEADTPENTKQIFQPLGSRPVWQTEFTTLNIEETTSGIELRLSSRMSLELVSEREEDFFLAEFSPQPSVRALHGQFELMAQQHPSKIAVQFETKEQIPLTIVLILSLLKLGAAYLPVSPENPLNWNLFVALEANAKIARTEIKHSEYFPAEKLSSIFLDQVNLGDHSALKPDVEVRSEDAGYLICTSGSTGVPKAVAAINIVSHLRKDGHLISAGDVLKFPSLKEMAERMREENVKDTDVEKATFKAPDEIRSAISTSGLFPEDYEDIYPCPPGLTEFLTQGHRLASFWCLMTIRSTNKGTNIEMWIVHSGKWYGVVLKDATPIAEIHSPTSQAEKQQILERIWKGEFIFSRPVIRYALLQYPDGNLEVVTKMDHGLYDGTLLRIFDTHFQTYQQNTPVEEFTSFRSFAHHAWQSERAPALEFWTQPSKRPIGFKFPQVPQGTQPQVNNVVFLTTDIQLDLLVRATGATPSIVFQAIFQIWLAHHSHRKDIGFDYLYTGRNVDLPNPQSINGTYANFLPMRSTVFLDDNGQNSLDYSDLDSISAPPPLTASNSWHSYLQTTQDVFWQYTEHYTMGLEDIYAACFTTRELALNNTLFLFQPFEPKRAQAPTTSNSPSTPSQDQELLKWIVMAESQVTMPQPYALVTEVTKTASGGHRFRFMFDDMAISREEAERACFAMAKMLVRAVEMGSGNEKEGRVRDMRIGDLGRGLLHEGLSWIRGVSFPLLLIFAPPSSLVSAFRGFFIVVKTYLLVMQCRDDHY